MREKLLQLMKEKNIRPAQLAKITGLSTSTIDYIVKGKIDEMNIGVSKMVKIANALDTSVEYLYDIDEPSAEMLVQNQDEKRLVSLFRDLNEEGREKALSYLEDLVDTGKYKKYNQDGMAEKAV